MVNDRIRELEEYVTALPEALRFLLDEHIKDIVTAVEETIQGEGVCGKCGMLHGILEEYVQGAGFKWLKERAEEVK